MHAFYERVNRVFRYAGSNRNRFCKKWGFNYQTLQAYWNTDRLPPGAVLEALAREYKVSIDAMVFGDAVPYAPTSVPAPGNTGSPASSSPDDEWAELEEIDDPDPPRDTHQPDGPRQRDEP